MAVTRTQLFANNAASTLAGNISAGALSLSVAPGDGTLYPSPSASEFFLVTLSDALTGLNKEIVKVTAVSGDAFTIVRAQEGTSAQSWLAGDTVQMRPTAGSMANMTQPPQLQTVGGGYAENTGTENALVITLDVVPNNLSDLIGSPIRIKKDVDPNDGAVTLAVNGFAAKPVVDLSGNALISNAIPGNAIFTVVYDGTSFYMQSASSAPGGPGRTTLNGHRNFYVSTVGNDSNDGLSSGTPWLTIQHAWDVIFQSYDLSGFNVTVNIADGTYTAGVHGNGRLLGAETSSSLTFQSASGNPAACIVNGTDNTFSSSDGAQYKIVGMTVTSSGGNALNSGGGGRIDFDNLICGTMGAGHDHLAMQNGGRIGVAGSYSIAGNARSHFNTTQNGVFTYDTAVTVTLTGTPAFTDFGIASNGGVASVPSGSVTFSGGATGARYSATTNGVIDTQGGGSTYLPGSTGGSTATGGQYV